jgi:hypothetical protein
VDGEINRASQKEAQIMKERGRKVLALIPLNLDGFLFSADYQSGKKSAITSRVAATTLPNSPHDSSLCVRGALPNSFGERFQLADGGVWVLHQR